MTKTMTGAVAALTIGCAAVVAAQAPQTGSQTPGSQSSAQAGSMTLSGCLERGDQSGKPVGTTGTAGAPAGSTFLLTNAAKSSGASASGAAGAPSSTGTAGAGAGAAPSSGAAAGGAGMTYILEDTAELAKHVGHQIEVTGTIASGSSSGAAGAPSAAPGATSGAGATAGAGATSGAGASGASSAQRLRVSSVRMIAATCTK